jgi:predicted O-methyltransferase YrrM
MAAIKQFLKQFKIVRDLYGHLHPQAPLRGVDLQVIENLSLPNNDQFQKTAESAERIEGMFSPFSMAAVDMMLSLQESLGAKGDILEIGTYRGKSAALLGTHLRAGEKLTLVDIADYLDPASILDFKDRTDFILAPSSLLKSNLPNYRARRGTFRFIHIDASHGYDETFHELGMADDLLAPLGIISMDDFTNLNYSQNIAAIFKYLYTVRTKLVMLLATDEKAYLCRKENFDLFADLILRRGIAEIRCRGVDALLARTSYGPEYAAFYLRRREKGETGSFYGVDIYRSQIVGV